MSSQLVAFSPVAVGILGLLLALFFYVKVKSLPGGNETMARIATYIRQGAMAFVWRQNKVLFIYCLIVAGLIFVGFNYSVLAGLSFVFCLPHTSCLTMRSPKWSVGNWPITR